MGVPQLRAEFLRAFGQPTASNNSAWLRRKLAEARGETACELFLCCAWI